MDSHRIIFLINLCLTFFTTVNNAQDLVQLDSFLSIGQLDREVPVNTEEVTLQMVEQFELFIDSSGAYTFDNLSEFESSFNPVDCDAIFNERNPVWVKVQLQGHSLKDDDYLFLFSEDRYGEQSWDHIAAYMIHANDSISRVVSGNAIPNVEKSLPSELNFGKFHIKRGELVTLYVRLEGKQSEDTESDCKVFSIFLVSKEIYPGAFAGYPFAGFFWEKDPVLDPFGGNQIVNHQIYVDRSKDADVNFIVNHWDDLALHDPFDLVQEPGEVYWLKTEFYGNPYFVGEQLLQVSYKAGNDIFGFDRIDAYLSNGGRNLVHRVAGDRISKSKRSYSFWANLIPFHIEPNDTLAIFVRLEGSSSNDAMSYLLLQHIDKRSMFPQQVDKAFQNGLFYGVLGIQFLFFLLLFTIERDIIHFYFCVIVLGGIFALGVDWENFYSFVVVPVLKDWHVPGHFLGLYFCVFGFIKFTETYFSYSDTNNISKRWIPSFLVLGFMLTGFYMKTANFATVFDNTVPINEMLIFTIAGIIFTFVLAIKAPAQRGKLKFFFYISFIPITICTLLLFFSTIAFNVGLDFISTGLLDQLKVSVKFTYVALLTLLALSVGYRTNILKEDQKLAIELSKKNSIIEAKNAQNELLLKEIHHRVKNNLEVVSSLLELQSVQLKNSVAQGVLRDSQSRVLSMGIIHQKLYQGENLACIEMKDYFKNLCESILDTYDAWEKVDIEYDMNEIELDVDTAVPIGLILNELFINSLKYAFPDGVRGHFCIHLSLLANQRLSFIVEDNGVGKPNVNVDGESGFGTQLVNLLTKQLHGSIREESSDGLKLSFNFRARILV